MGRYRPGCEFERRVVRNARRPALESSSGETDRTAHFSLQVAGIIPPGGFRQHEVGFAFEIELPDPGAAAFVFTFGGEEAS
jgi:hypothetical protein